MKKFLRILIFILVLLLVLFIIAMFVSPTQMKLEETETMDAPPNMIYNIVNDFKTWESWSPWAEMDPNATNTYSEKTSGVGAVWSWDGDPKTIGKGSQKIEESVMGKSIKTSLDFSGFDTAYANWSFDKEGDKTKVTWNFESAEFPIYLRPFIFFGNRDLKKTYRKGLANIEKLVDQRVKEKKYRGFKINEIDMPEKNYVMNRAVVNMDNIQQFYTQNLGALFGKLQGANIEMDGMPSGLFFKWNESEGSTDMAASIPIKDAVNVKGATSLNIPAGRALQIDYYGDYSKTANAHYAIDDYMRDHGLFNNSPIVEEYVTDPVEEKDPAKWLTKITYYLAEN